MNPWIWLTIAITSEVIGTTALKEAEGFTKWIPSIVVVGGYTSAFYCLSMTLKHMEISTVYAIWSALGVAFITVIGIFFYQESMTWFKAGSLALIIAGVVGLRLASENIAS
ncbi:MAG: multidrug efflux SMR transporter [SAR324 cluster bacterium]|nr:multidrug efflux SMR transporter [SAR324 cluster bacterium]